jgi:aspartyl-tRNA(Asn)/glutamyl-tRNA(Gln) amidotransferase subunit C
MTQPATKHGLTRAEVDHVAQLARLALTAEEAERYRTQMASILDQVAVLDELDLASIPPSAGVHPLLNVMGEDKPQPSLTLAQVLANAPQQEEGHFRVPAIFEE